MIPTRAEFMFFSQPEKVLFYALIYLSLIVMTAQIYRRVARWLKGRPVSAEDRTHPRRWVANVWRHVLAQYKVRQSRQKSGAPMHLAIFYGFMTLLLATTLLGINTYSPIKFHKGLYYLIYEEVADWMGLVFILGVLWAFARRWRLSRPPLPSGERAGGEGRNPQTTRPSDYWTLALLLALGITGFWVEAARISVAPKPWDWVDPIGGTLAHMEGDWSGLASKALVYKSIWWFHAFWVMAFFCVLPNLRLRHIMIAVGSTAGKPDRPTGKLRLIPIAEVEETGQVGVAKAADYSRWHLMSLDACMECGRCTEVCPAWSVGKVLDPKQVVQGIRTSAEDPVVAHVSEEALWACTTCHACVEACPVLIRHVDLIVDARRNLVSEGKLSGSAAMMLRQTASSGSPWGSPASSREDWMAGLDIPLCRDGIEFEWLFWVGCAGATDPGAIKTTKAVALLLKQAGVSFACLGNEEACTGDPARRVGEEFLFQEMAGQNLSVFERYGIKKVVTPCPHCFNTLKNEYGDPDLPQSRQLEVLHHSELLARLTLAGSLRPAQARGAALHDPCYLSRVNGVVEPQRAALGDPRVPEHAGRKTLCCGAGGGRMWMEEPSNQRPGNRRAQELLDTGAEKVAVACPFCRIMLGDSLRQVAPDREVEVIDLAELVLQANAPVRS